MVRIILRGYKGRMGQAISEMVDGDGHCAIVAGIDIDTRPQRPSRQDDYPVYTDLAECGVEADVIVDVSMPEGIERFIEEAVDRRLPVVLCTTGLSGEQLSLLESASKKIAILRSANMSLGVNVLLKLVKMAARVLASDGFDIEVVERHHRMKVDAPSGTALMLADAMNGELENEFAYNYDRSKERKQRDKKEIGISAVRGGTIVGEHEVIFAGLDEVVEIKHVAYSRAIFANGAIRAAKFLCGREAGMYDMGDVIR